MLGYFQRGSPVDCGCRETYFTDHFTSGSVTAGAFIFNTKSPGRLTRRPVTTACHDAEAIATVPKPPEKQGRKPLFYLLRADPDGPDGGGEQPTASKERPILK